jgi:hypothetical protein
MNEAVGLYSVIAAIYKTEACPDAAYLAKAV